MEADTLMEADIILIGLALVPVAAVIVGLVFVWLIAGTLEKIL